jgi:hypothetical protein
VVSERLEQLLDAAVDLGLTDVPGVDGLDARKAKAVLNKVRQWATDAARTSLHPDLDASEAAEAMPEEHPFLQRIRAKDQQRKDAAIAAEQRQQKLQPQKLQP